MDAKQITAKGFDVKKFSSSVRYTCETLLGLLVIDNARNSKEIKGCFPETDGHVFVTRATRTGLVRCALTALQTTDSMILLKKSVAKNNSRRRNSKGSPRYRDSPWGTASLAASWG